MGRPLRIEYPGAFYHITSRGNERRPIFRAKTDYERIIGYLESATERYGAKIHCFCLMPNHYHLLLETPRANLSAILHHINTSYTNYFNKKTARVGHLLQGRYRAILVDKDSYALELSRYIHLNPVRANLVRAPLDYPWNSYAVYVEETKSLSWVETAFILGQMGKEGRASRKKYSNFVREGMEKSLKDPLRQAVASTLLGSERFIQWVKEKWVKGKKIGRDIPALRRLSSGPDLAKIQKQSERMFGAGTMMSRRVGLYLSHRLSGRPLGEIGKSFGGIGPSAVSQNTRRFRVLLGSDPELAKKVARLNKQLSE